MKFIKPFNIFESLKDIIDIEEIEDRLIDFQHLGFSVVVSLSSSTILDFDKKRLERSQTNNVVDLADSYHIRSSEIDRYNSGISHNSLTIRLSALNKEESHINLNIDEFTLVYDDFCHYLKQVYDLKPNYINIESLSLRTNSGGGYGGRFLYFKDFQSIREFLKVKVLVSNISTDMSNLKVSGFNLGFYK